jgi:hypothetical protein
VGLALLAAVLADLAGWPEGVSVSSVLAITLIGVYLLFAVKIANQWEKAVVSLTASQPGSTTG